METPYTMVSPTFAQVEALQAAYEPGMPLSQLIRLTVEACVRFAPGHSLDAMSYSDARALFRECQEMLYPKEMTGTGMEGSPPEAASER